MKMEYELILVRADIDFETHEIRAVLTADPLKYLNSSTYVDFEFVLSSETINLLRNEVEIEIRKNK